jgi:tripeptide aminopeptidase
VRSLGKPAMGFNVDGGNPARLVVGAIGADRWQAHVHGRSSHAGLAPEEGVSAVLIASRAIAEVSEQGWFGKVEKRNKRGTSNVGILRGGEATNQVTDYVYVKGECRSHDEKLLARITAAYRKSFERAAGSVKSSKGVRGKVEFEAERDYDAFRMKDDSPPVVAARGAAEAIGLEPVLEVADGGLDANYLNAKGIPTVTLGAGQHNPHTVDEYVDIAEYLDGCRLLLRLAAVE